MIKKFDEYIAERLFNANVKRASVGDVRREDGVKVKTCLGIDIITHNPEYDFNALIEIMLKNFDRGDYLCFVEPMNSLSQVDRHKIMKDESSCNKYISDVQGGLMFGCWEYKGIEQNLKKRANKYTDGFNEDVYKLVINALVEWFRTHPVFKGSDRKTYVTIIDEDEIEKFVYWSKIVPDSIKYDIETALKIDLRSYHDRDFGGLCVGVDYELIMNYDKIKQLADKLYKKYRKEEGTVTNERLFNNGVKRAQTGKIRSEDIRNNNIHTFKEVDLGLPFVFADRNLFVDGMDRFNSNTLRRDAIPCIEGTGWRFLTLKEVEEYIIDASTQGLKGDLRLGSRTEGSVTLFNNEHPITQSVPFRVYSQMQTTPYWLDDGRVMNIVPPKYPVKSMCNKIDTGPYWTHMGGIYCRLVKDKK